MLRAIGRPRVVANRRTSAATVATLPSSGKKAATERGVLTSTMIESAIATTAARMLIHRSGYSICCACPLIGNRLPNVVTL